ncbi:hypothetical protein DERF_002100 [Dermatophagoides farinae]|uniref:Uncharacterized protein n=1 Tax=Dermatophagoides farinae TaxID=6954 RepID=A0A922LD76_DERFA|nr:hypothetical protein DERF_002100 [Dermatophagoides farinae]
MLMILSLDFFLSNLMIFEPLKKTGLLFCSFTDSFKVRKKNLSLFHRSNWILIGIGSKRQSLDNDTIKARNKLPTIIVFLLLYNSSMKTLPNPIM